MNELTDFKNNDFQDESYPQLTIADTDWTDKEQSAMREQGYDGMDMLRAWLS